MGRQWGRGGLVSVVLQIWGLVHCACDTRRPLEDPKHGQTDTRTDDFGPGHKNYCAQISIICSRRQVLRNFPSNFFLYIFLFICLRTIATICNASLQLFPNSHKKYAAYTDKKKRALDKTELN